MSSHSPAVRLLQWRGWLGVLLWALLVHGPVSPVALALAAEAPPSESSESVTVIDDCSLLVVGGSTAAVAAALTAATQAATSTVCLLEPTGKTIGHRTGTR
jgi:hypothetical protein